MRSRDWRRSYLHEPAANHILETLNVVTHFAEISVEPDTVSDDPREFIWRASVTARPDLCMNSNPQRERRRSPVIRLPGPKQTIDVGSNIVEPAAPLRSFMWRLFAREWIDGTGFAKETGGQLCHVLHELFVGRGWN